MSRWCARNACEIAVNSLYRHEIMKLLMSMSCKSCTVATGTGNTERPRIGAGTVAGSGVSTVASVRPGPGAEPEETRGKWRWIVFRNRAPSSRVRSPGAGPRPSRIWAALALRRAASPPFSGRCRQACRGPLHLSTGRVDDNGGASHGTVAGPARRPSPAGTRHRPVRGGRRARSEGGEGRAEPGWPHRN